MQLFCMFTNNYFNKAHSVNPPHFFVEIDTAAIQANKQLKIENEELRRRLAAFERVSDENHELRRSKEETDVLRSCLSSAQDEVSRLLDEKIKLLETIKKLQEQLSPDKNRQWNSKR